MMLRISCSLLLFFSLPVFAYESFHRNLHADRLSFWKSKGFEPKVIYDIGAFNGGWTRTAKQIFPKAQFFLFEANEHHKPSLAETGFPYFIALLGDQDTTITFYSNGSTGDSVFLEQTNFYQGRDYQEKQLRMTTLAHLVKQHNLPLPDFIKMDVQGAEYLIINGSPEIIKNAEAIVLETKILEYNKGAPFAHTIIALMSELGYSFIDVFECNYLYTGELNEIDLLFVKQDSKLIKTGNLSN
jgi:FkbM family methyltransferase